MRKGIEFTVSTGDQKRLNAIIADRNAAQKHVWRPDRSVERPRRRHPLDHCDDWQVQNLRLAMAGAVHD